MQALINALPHGARLVLVGDADQLPPVGPGTSARLITSHRVPTIQLTEIFRQAQQSDIVMNAHAVNAGEMPSHPVRTATFHHETGGSGVCYRNGGTALRPETAQALRLHSCHRYSAFACQAARSGTIPLNRRLQEALNPPSESKLEKRFGDNHFREATA